MENKKMKTEIDLHQQTLKETADKNNKYDIRFNTIEA
jgi:hypothetical protein